MKSVLIITASFGKDKKHKYPVPNLAYKDYVIHEISYDNSNTMSRENSMHPRLKAKIPKMMGWMDFPDYDYYIWSDSTTIIWETFMDDLMEFDDDEQADLFLFKHIKRSSIQSELEYLNDRMANGNAYLIERYAGEMINEQVNKYLSDETFVDNTLFAGGCFMYRKRLFQNKNYNLMTDWLLHNVLYSLQDQLSLPYLIHKHQTKYRVYNMSYGKVLKRYDQ